MEIRIPRPGDVYRHFKGNIYEIIIIARDSETLEEKVVYKELHGDAAYVRSLPMFVSPVDKTKYPNATQMYRFEYVETLKTESEDTVSQEPEVEMEDAALILNFLDQETAKDKINYLVRMKDCVTENFLEIAAQSLDFVENAGDLDERYEAILQYLRMIEKYEKDRTR